MLHLLRKKTSIKTITAACLLDGELLFLPVNPGAIHCQVELNMPDHDAKPYYFGITIGMNLARFHTDLHPRF